MPPTESNLESVRSTRSQYLFSQLISAYPARLNVVAEGDSWFAYPPSGLAVGKFSNVIDYLCRKEKFNLLQLASNGDEAVNMLSGESKLRLLKVLNRYHIDFLLFSGGGNDIVGRYDFDFFLKENGHSSKTEDYLHLPRVRRRLTSIRNAYEDLIELCREYSEKNKAIKIVTHCYDYALPSPKGAEFVGGLIQVDGGKSWMYPYLMEKGIPQEMHGLIIKYLIDALADILVSLQKKSPGKLLVADTRGVLDPQKDWLNEIHPTPGGFKKIADKIFAEMNGGL
jgi:hypothetical protein